MAASRGHEPRQTWRGEGLLGRLVGFCCRPPVGSVAKFVDLGGEDEPPAGVRQQQRSFPRRCVQPGRPTPAPPVSGASPAVRRAAPGSDPPKHAPLGLPPLGFEADEHIERTYGPLSDVGNGKAPASITTVQLLLQHEMAAPIAVTSVYASGSLRALVKLAPRPTGTSRTTRKPISLCQQFAEWYRHADRHPAAT